MSRYPFATSRICSHDEKDALAWCWISGSAIAGQCVCMLMHLRCCLHPSSTPACVLKELIDSGLGAKEKAINIFFAVESIRPDSIKHLSAPSTPLPPETPPLRDKKQSNQSMSQSGSQLVVESVALVLLPSLCGVSVKRMFDTTGCFWGWKAAYRNAHALMDAHAESPPPPLALCS